MADSEYKAGLYLEREASVTGRIVNSFVDLGRGILGKPSLWVQARDLEKKEALGKKGEKDQPAEIVSRLTAANDPPRDFSQMISTALETSGLDAKSQFQALSMIDNAAVYLHQAEPSNRSARAATPGSIGAEWNQLGLTEVQADEMITKAVGYTQEKAHALRADRVAERLAAEMTRSAPDRSNAAVQSVERETPALVIGGR